ncbi:hypothetical protein EYD45_16260 [Hyunsoonleella flava]|uniref:Uncharacterized protein n=1 Tax=Hyunsoonleella flava TaxID=2527939 RepID=A0A4Q9FG43_9FLAO|nr:hypothetical protein [Hyunsoonleella flava]TBM98503.1 hypothetical protein EYD45_16260 [Hyunsoonleella flava]
MKTNYLLPNKYKIPGWILLMSGLITGLIQMIYGVEPEIFEIKVPQILSSSGFFDDDKSFLSFKENNIFDEIISVLIIIGGLLVGFTKEKEEDEFIYKLRKDSLVWAIILNYSILLFSVMFIYDMPFLNVMIYNMFTPLLFFIIRFNFLKLKSRSDEE